MRIRFQSKSIRTKLIFWFFMTALVPLLIVAAIDAYSPVKAAFWSRVPFLLGAGAVVYVIAIFLARSISEPIVGMTKAAEKMQAGDFSVRHRIESHDEMGSLARSLNTMADAVSSQIAIQRGSGEITETMATANELQEAVENVDKKLIDLTGSDFGACYIFNEGNDRFENLGSIEISSELLERFKTDNQEGLLGKVISTRNVSVIRKVTHDTIFTFKTSTGTVLPREIITVPLIAESRVSAIVALANLGEYSPESIEILDQSWPGMNAATSNLIANDKMRQLTETLNIKNEELQSQTRELQAQSQELQEQNVELKAQSEQLREQNAELQVQREQVERARCVRNEFLPNMSHELRTLLSSILALSHVLIVQAGERLSEKEGSYLEIIERNGKRLLSLINDILDISKIEAGKMDVSVEVFSLGSTIAEITERLSVMAEDKGSLIEHDIPDDMHIESNRRKVEQVFQNIISNAVKFTEHGKIAISARADESNAYIDVTDTGIGIAQADLPCIFDEFRQVGGSSPGHLEGTGLGLAIAKRFTEMLGGNISVSSKLGEGSTFTLTLPIKWQGSVEAVLRPALGAVGHVTKPVDEEALTSVAPDAIKRILAGIKPGSRRQTATDIGKNARKRILLIEDNPDSRTTLQAVLGARYVLLEADDGEQGLASIIRERPDLVLLDMALPGIDGLAVVQRIKENEKTAEIPVIALTARAMKGDREKTLAAGCDDYVSKPFDAEELLTKVNSFLGEVDLSSLNGVVDHLVSGAVESGRICSDESLASSEQDEAPEDDLASSVQKNREQLTKCQMQSGAEKDMDLGVCPAATSTDHDGTTRWGVFGRKLGRLISDGVRLCRRKDSSQGRYTRRVERIEKRLRKFIETDSEDTLPKTKRP